MLKHPVLLVIHIMYGLHLSVYDGKAAQEYELALPKNIYKSIAKKWLTNGNIILHLHFSDITYYDIFHSQVFALLMLFLCVILHTMASGKSLQLLCILPFGMLCLSAISMMFVKIMLAVCILVGMVV